MRLSTSLPVLVGLLGLFSPAAAQPDLQITATAEDSEGEAGDRVTLDYTVSLTGAEEIEDISVGFYFSTDQTLSNDDAFSEREEVDAESDESESDNEQIDIPGSLSAGDYFLLVVIDDQDEIAESDEANNTVAIPFTVTSGDDDGGGGGDGGANLVVTSASAEPSSAAAGSEVEVSYALANQGDEQAGESSLAFYFSSNTTLSSNDVLAAREDVDEADANDTSDDGVELTVPASLAAGDYFLLVVADDRGTVTESDESDNVFSIPFTVTGDGDGGGGTADLVVAQATAGAASGEEGDAVQVSYAVGNEGDEQAGSTTVAFYFSRDRFLSASDVLAATEDLDEVDAGDSEDGEVTLTVPDGFGAGDAFILVVADDGNAVSEQNEGNNVSDIAFRVVDGTATEPGAEAGFYLRAPAPNPSAGSVVEVRYQSPAGTHVRLAVYDVLGREVGVLVEGAARAGEEAARWEAAPGLSAGTYLVRLSTDERVAVRRVTLVR